MQVEEARNSEGPYPWINWILRSVLVSAWIIAPPINVVIGAVWGGVHASGGQLPVDAYTERAVAVRRVRPRQDLARWYTLIIALSTASFHLGWLALLAPVRPGETIGHVIARALSWVA